MQDGTKNPACDTCDGKLTKVDSPGEGDGRRRFLDEYRRRPIVAFAARLAGVHRATVYRWMADPLFASAARTAAEEFYRDHRSKVLAEEAARRIRREERERERRPMRLRNLEIARAARRESN